MLLGYLIAHVVSLLDALKIASATSDSVLAVETPDTSEPTATKKITTTAKTTSETLPTLQLRHLLTVLFPNLTGELVIFCLFV